MHAYEFEDVKTVDSARYSIPIRISLFYYEPGQTQISQRGKRDVSSLKIRRTMDLDCGGRSTDPARYHSAGVVPTTGPTRHLTDSSARRED